MADKVQSDKTPAMGGGKTQRGLILQQDRKQANRAI